MPTRSAVALSLAIIALVPPTPAGAQSWTPVRGAPGPALQDVCILPDGVHGWAVGGSGAAGQVLGCVLRTVDGGANWTPLPFPNPTGVALNGVDFVDPATGWVVGSGGAIYRTLDGGDTWTPQASGTSRKLSKVCFVDAERGWAAGGWGDGSAYLVLRTQNGGLTWQSQSFGTTAHSCDDVVFVDELNGWICGYDSSFNPHIHRTANGGTTWTRQTVPIAGSNATASSIDFVSPTEGWATISSLYVSPVGPILHTTNGGTTWTVQGYTGLHYDYAIDARDALHAAITSVQILPPAQERVFVTAPTAAETGSRAPRRSSTTPTASSMSAAACGSAPTGARSCAAPTRAPRGIGSTGRRAGAVHRSEHRLDAVGGQRLLRVAHHRWGTALGAELRGHRQLDRRRLLRERDSRLGLRRQRHHPGHAGRRRELGPAGERGEQLRAGGRLRRSGRGLGGRRLRGRRGLHPPHDRRRRQLAAADARRARPLPGGVLPRQGARLAGRGERARPPHRERRPDLADRGLGGPRVHRRPGHDRRDHRMAGGAPGEDGRGFVYRTDSGGASWTLEWSGPWVLSSVGDLALREAGEPWACGAHDAVLRYTDPAGVYFARLETGEGTASWRICLTR